MGSKISVNHFNSGEREKSRLERNKRQNNIKYVQRHSGANHTLLFTKIPSILAHYIKFSDKRHVRRQSKAVRTGQNHTRLVMLFLILSNSYIQISAHNEVYNVIAKSLEPEEARLVGGSVEKRLKEKSQLSQKTKTIPHVNPFYLLYRLHMMLTNGIKS